MSSIAKYISQGPGENNCGAFALAYYTWEASDSEHTVNPVADRAFIQDIYTEIKFDNSDYSSPRKMIEFLCGKGKTAKLVAEASLEKDKEKFGHWIDCDIYFIGEELAAYLTAGQYAILICINGNTEGFKLHYIMIRKKKMGGFTIIDPNNGVEQTGEIIAKMQSVGNSAHWKFLGAALVIE